MRTSVVWSMVGAAVLSALVFGVFPDLDLTVAGWFYRGHNTFVAQTPLGDAIRRTIYWIPTAVVVFYAGLYAMRRTGSTRLWAPSTRGLVFVALSFAIGPGLLVNVILKDHSHRPRPVQTQDFGGQHAFVPFYRWNGACDRNCSFVSGEGATSVWTLAPALIAPMPVRAAAIAASILLAVITSTLRMAFGGHYLSDTAFAAIFIVLVIAALARAVDPPERRSVQRSQA